MQNLEEIREEFGKYALDSDDSVDYTTRIIVEKFAINHFGKLPYLNNLADKARNEELKLGDPKNLAYEDIPAYDDDCDEEELREKHHNIDMEKTLDAIVTKYPETAVLNIRGTKITDAILINDIFVYYNGVFYMDTPDIPEGIMGCIVQKQDVPRIRWVLRNSQGHITTKYMEITPKGDIEMNYNDDFGPINEKVNKLIRSDESSIIIFHGKPGTGKTSYIRDLINSNRDVNFYWLDASMFAYIDSAEFIQYIASCKNAVFILEDSEDLLKPRDQGRNAAMQSLLSISDGMLGDSLKIKFICTFNTALTNIDEAITRKGRCKIKYEFKPLKKDKVKAIFKSLGLDENLATEDKALCEVYNFLEDNGVETERKRIGF